MTSSQAAFPSKLGSYDIVEVLGEGGTGVVVRAIHSATGAVVAIKFARQDRPEMQALLRREAAVLRRLNRDALSGVVRVLTVGEDEVPWYAMEYLDGPSLAVFGAKLWLKARDDREAATVSIPDVSLPSGFESAIPGVSSDAPVAQPRLPAAAGQLSRALMVLLRLAEVVRFVHSQGVAHGDLSPNNVILRDEGDPVLIDFGAALDNEVSRGQLWADRPKLGTPGYIAPERIVGALMDTRSDLYSLGCIAYEMLTGSKPFSAPRTEDLLRQHVHRKPRPPSELVWGLPSPIEALVMALLERDPRDRISRAEDVAHALRTELGESSRGDSSERNPPLFRAELHGRTGVLELLCAALHELGANKGHVFLVAGIAGMGKSRLLNELARRASSSGHRFVECQGQATSAVGAVVHAAALTAFAPVVRQAVAEFATDPEWWPSFANLAPVLPAECGKFTRHTPETDPDRVARAALEALNQIVIRLGRARGLLLLVDDLHLADELSLRFLNQYAPTLPDGRVLFVGTFRSESSPVVERLHQLPCTKAVLEPLTQADVAAVAREVLGVSTLPEGLLDFLLRRAEGVPWYVVEYVRALVGHGRLARKTGGRWEFAWSGQHNDLPLPESIDKLLFAQTNQLSEPGKLALRFAAVLGREFDVRTFANLAEQEDMSVEELEELLARDFLERANDGRVRFGSELLRQAQLRVLPAQEKQHLHMRVAAALESKGGQPEDAAMVGYHWAFASQEERAIPHLETAARIALDAHALERATELYQLCIRQYDALLESGRAPAQAAIRLSELCETTADLLIKRAQHVEAREYLLRVIEVSKLPIVRARAHRKLGASYWTQHDYPTAATELSAAMTALAELEERDDAFWTELIQIKLGHFERLYFAGKVGAELEGLVDELGGLMEQHGTNEQRCIYFQTAASHALLRSRYSLTAQSLELARRGVDAAQSLPSHRRALARFIYAGALMLGTKEQCQAAIPEFERSLAEARDAGVTLLSRIQTYLALCLLRTGDVEATQRAALSALEAAEAARLNPYIAAANACLGWVAWRKDQPEDADRLLRSARTVWEQQPHKFMMGNLALFPLIAMRQERGELELALPLLEQLKAGLPALPEALSLAIDRAIEVLGNSPRQASDALLQLVQRARQLGFA